MPFKRSLRCAPQVLLTQSLTDEHVMYIIMNVKRRFLVYLDTIYRQKAVFLTTAVDGVKSSLD